MILLDTVAALGGGVVATLVHCATTLVVGASNGGGFVCCPAMIAVSSWVACMCLVLSVDNFGTVPSNTLRRSAAAAMERSCCKVTGTWHIGSELGTSARCQRSGSGMLQECRIRGIGSGWRQVRRRSHWLHVAPRKFVILDCGIPGLWFLVGPGVSC